ncbi:MAG: hypothetical protein IJ800_01765 [Clostridia bacterium]|nr:hypothetical protein [Clostridia bacterium]
MNRDEKLYFGKTESFNSLLELFNCGDLQFSYGGHKYNITIDFDVFTNRPRPCIANNDDDLDLIEDRDEREREYCRRAGFFDSVEEMYLNYKFPDGRPILDVLASDDFDIL